MQHRTKVRLSKKVVLAPLKWVCRLFEKIVDYTGPFATILKGLPVAAMFLIIYSPWILYTWLLNIAQSTKPPFCYFLYILWWAYFGLAIYGASVVGYLMETKTSSWWLPKSLEYQRQKTKKQQWNIDKSVKEYLEVLDKQENNH